VAILAGIVTLFVGFATDNHKTQEYGVLICALGVFEVTAREHFSGFRSHTILLAFLPAVIVEVLWAVTIGVPDQRLLLLVPPIPVFLFCFFLLRRRFQVARHNRVVGHR
jgi:predicted neutral ceramidase superfamily lipid hydrolase